MPPIPTIAPSKLPPNHPARQPTVQAVKAAPTQNSTKSTIARGNLKTLSSGILSYMVVLFIGCLGDQDEAYSVILFVFRGV